MYNFDLVTNACVKAWTDEPRQEYVIMDSQGVDYNRSEDIKWLQGMMLRLKVLRPDETFTVKTLIPVDTGAHNSTKMDGMPYFWCPERAIWLTFKHMYQYHDGWYTVKPIQA